MDPAGLLAVDNPTSKGPRDVRRERPIDTGTCRRDSQAPQQIPPVERAGLTRTTVRRAARGWSAAINGAQAAIARPGCPLPGAPGIQDASGSMMRRPRKVPRYRSSGHRRHQGTRPPRSASRTPPTSGGESACGTGEIGCVAQDHPISRPWHTAPPKASPAPSPLTTVTAVELDDDAFPRQSPRARRAVLFDDGQVDPRSSRRRRPGPDRSHRPRRGTPGDSDRHPCSRRKIFARHAALLGPPEDRPVVRSMTYAAALTPAASRSSQAVAWAVRLGSATGRSGWSRKSALGDGDRQDLARSRPAGPAPSGSGRK